jgi:hypothetical protein
MRPSTLRGSAAAASRALALAATFAALACVSRAHEDVGAARAHYAQCVAASGERACRAEQERVLAAERTYQ